jgi:hypothetical protein
MIYMHYCSTEDDKQVADQHEEILAGLAKERAHSRFRIWSGNHQQGMTLRDVQWTYDGAGGMVKIAGLESRAFI